MKPEVNILWLRRDLRLNDNNALHNALKGSFPVLPVFIFDKYILNQLEDKADRRVEFIHATLQEMQTALINLGSSLEVYDGFPAEVFQVLLKKYTIETVFTNHDYEPYAIKRDEEIKSILQSASVWFRTYKDQVIFEKGEILKENNTPYTIFTPYSRKWKALLDQTPVNRFSTEKRYHNFYEQSALAIPTLQSMGFKEVGKPFPSKELQEELVKKYSETRDYPSVKNGTSRLGVHLRFGTISIRQVVKKALALNETFLNELIWREFYQMILWHFPKVGNGRAFKEENENIPWRNNEEEFEKWCEGNTGYAIVDAGMRELNATGFMHNRVRMITASFLTKHLLIDWRWGEAYFAQKLLDYELASNNGGWQWAAGSGCDAVPYFRIFNPTLQVKKFDKDLEYVKRWVPEFQEFNYPKPMVIHEEARKRALMVYANALKK